MPVKVAAAPKNALKLLQTGVEQHLADIVDATLGEIEGLATPHQVFHLGLDALVSEKPIASAAKHVAWSAESGRSQEEGSCRCGARCHAPRPTVRLRQSRTARDREHRGRSCRRAPEPRNEG